MEVEGVVMVRTENRGSSARGEYLVIDREVVDEVELHSVRRVERARKRGKRGDHEAWLRRRIERRIARGSLAFSF